MIHTTTHIQSSKANTSLLEYGLILLLLFIIGIAASMAIHTNERDRMQRAMHLELERAPRSLDSPTN